MQLNFIKENCQRLISVLTSLEARETPLACSVYNFLDLQVFEGLEVLPHCRNSKGDFFVLKQIGICPKFLEVKG